MLISKYAKEVKRFFEPFFVEKQPVSTTQRCCISLANSEITFIQLNKTQGETELLLSEQLQYDDFNTLPLILTSLVKKHNLQFIPTYWLLPPDDYQLFLIDSLPVEKDEVRDALNWRIRNLINYPIEDAKIDYFKLPPKKTSSENMIGAVAARINNLIKVIDILQKAGLYITTIDIPEFALRNLTAITERDEKSTAFIYFYKQEFILNITRQKTLYFTRRINYQINHDTKEINFELISLEVLRYFDYFQSQWRYPSPSRIYVAGDINSSDLIKKLSEYLLTTVELFPLNNIILNKEKADIIKKKFLLTFGCALREEKEYVTAEH